jgi:hypothetical protein
MIPKLLNGQRTLSQDALINYQSFGIIYNHSRRQSGRTTIKGILESIDEVVKEHTLTNRTNMDTKTC